MGKMFMAATNYLPSQVSGMMSQDRAFATVRLNFSGQRNICVLSTYVRWATATKQDYLPFVLDKLFYLGEAPRFQ